MTVDELVAADRAATEAFVRSCVFVGRVLDYGCGLQPYKAIVEAAGGEYVPFDRAGFRPRALSRVPSTWAPADVGSACVLAEAWDVILCTQVAQYVADLPALLAQFRQALSACGGALVLTWPTCWPETFAGDGYRYTDWGMRTLAVEAGLAVERTVQLATHEAGDVVFALGYGMVARA